MSLNDLFRKKPLVLMTSAVALSLALAGCSGEDGDNGVVGTDGIDGIDGSNGVDGVDGIDGVDGVDGVDGMTNYRPTGLTRLATAPAGAEFTGLFLNDDGTLFMNFQHPDDTNTTADANGKVYDKGTVGVVYGVDFTDPTLTIPAVDMPILTADKELPQLAVGNYQVLGQNGDVMADGFDLGDIVAADGTTVLDNIPSPDFNGVVPSGTAGEYYVYTNWEGRPGGMSRITVSGLGANGYGLVNLDGMLDFSSVDGTWVNCFGTVSPWGTPLSAEELYFDNTDSWFDLSDSYSDNEQSMAAYFGYATDGSGNWANPYRIGYIVELTSATAASETNVVPEKRFAMGRFSHENAVVMPDNRTAYLSDDGTGTVFYKFVADTAGDLSAGTLYAAKITQANSITDPTEAALAIEWVELAHGDDATIETWIDDYDTATLASPDYITDQEINDWAEAKLSQDIDGDDTVATSPFTDDRPAFLESRKAAVALGATGEFRKMEGVNINYGLASTWWNAGTPDESQPAYMYLAMSNFNYTMGDTEGDIQLDATHGKCGAVYRMKLKQDGSLVDVDTMVPALVGGPYDGDRSENKCDVNNISEPDNLIVLDDGRVIIGEDTGNHENNMVWVFDDPGV